MELALTRELTRLISLLSTNARSFHSLAVCKDLLSVDGTSKASVVSELEKRCRLGHDHVRRSSRRVNVLMCALGESRQLQLFQVLIDKTYQKETSVSGQ